MSANNNTRNSHASLILFIIVSLALAASAATLVLGPSYSPYVGVASAQILAKIDAAFRSAVPTPWFRWFVLWSIAGAALSVIIGLLILPRSAKAPSNFQRTTIATAELSRIVVIVLAVGVSFFDFITAPKDPPLNGSRRAEVVKTTEAAPPSRSEREVTSAMTDEGQPQQATAEQQIAVATNEPDASSVKIESQTQSLSAKGDPTLQPPAQTQPPQPSRFEQQGAGSAPQQPGPQAPQSDSKGARETASSAMQGMSGMSGAQEPIVTNAVPDNLTLADELLPWERSPRDSRTGSTPNARPDPTTGRTKPPSQGGYGSNPPGGKSGPQNGYAAASPNPRDERDQGRQHAGACDSVRGRFYNIRGRHNPDYEATIEIMAKGRGLIRLMTRRGEVLLMDARVTACNNASITVVGSNGRTEAGVTYDSYKEDVFVAPTQRQPR